MERMELLQELRQSFVLISLTHSHKLKGDNLTREQRKTLIGLHEGIINAFHDNSIPFGSRRGVPKFMIDDIMTSAGKGLAELKQQVSSLKPDDAREFAIGIRYEPVPAADAFSDLPERYKAGFTRLLVDGAVRDYEMGMEYMVGALHSAVNRYVDRWQAYDSYVANPLKGERMLVRDSVCQAVTAKARVMRAANAARDTNIERFAAMSEFAGTPPNEVRNNKGTRSRVLVESRALLEVLRGYLGIGTGDTDIDQDED